MSDEFPRHRTCGQMVVHELLAETVPDYRANRLAVEDQTRQIIGSGEAMLMAARLVTIRVLVHVVHHTDEQNISDDQVRGQIDALNRDYRAQNDDKASVPPVWLSLLADTNVAFELASDGITRTETSVDGFGVDNAVKFSDRGGADARETDRVLNLWVCDLGPQLLGYAQFPGGPAETDGVVIHYRAFGTGGTATAPFHLGRTAVHEVGHFLGLRHIWGDRNDCTGNDFVADTPPAKEANVGKPVFPHITCNNGPSGDMFMNYMDYVDDDTMVMFSVGQIARMNATLAGPRESLIA
jgi:hypothetical protein